MAGTGKAERDRLEAVVGKAARELTRLKRELSRRQAALRELQAELETARARSAELERARKAMLGMLEDLEHNRRQIEQARREWSAAFDAVSDAIFLHDKEFRIVRANLAYARRAGLLVKAVIGKRYWEVFPKREGPLPGCTHTLRESVDEEITLEGGEIFHSRAFAVRDSEGAYLYSVHILEDVTERRRAETEQRTLSEALRQSAEAIVVLDAEARITYVSPAFTRLLGYTAEEILGRPIGFLAVAQAPRAVSPERVLEHVNKHGVWRGEVVRRAKDGTPIPIYLSAAAVRDSRGRLSGYVGAYLDLREIKEAERRIETLRGVIEDLSAELELDTLGRKAVEAALRLTGADAGVVPLLDDSGGHVHHRWHTGLPAQIVRALQHPFPSDAGLTGEVLRTGRSKVVADYARYRQALPEYVKLGARSILAAPVRVGDKVEGALVVASLKRTRAFHAAHVPVLEAIARQIGVAVQRQRLIDEVRASETRYRQVVERVPDILYSAALPDFRTTFVSPAVHDLLGFTVQEWLAEPTLWKRQVHEADRERLFQRLEAVLARGENAFTVEYRMWHKDGKTLRWFEDRGTVQRDAAGRAVAVSGVATDITARKEAERLGAWELQVNASLAELARALLSEASMSIEEISARVLAHGRRLTDSPFGYVGYIDADTGRLVSPTLAEPPWEGCRLVEDKGVVFERPAGPVRWVLEHEASLLTNAPAQDPRAAAMPQGRVPLERFVCAPALIGGRLVGQVALANAARDYAERDLRLVERLADVYALAIQRLRAAEALRASEAKHHAIFEQARDGIVLIDRDSGRIEDCNPEFARQSGRAREALKGMRIWELRPPQKVEAARRRFYKIRAKGVGGAIGLDFLRPDGTVVPIELRSRVVRIGTREYIQSITRDVTERRRIEGVMLRHARQQEAVAELGRRALAGVEPSRLMHAVARSLVNTLEVRYSQVLELLPGQKSLRLRAGAGWGKGVVGRITLDAGRHTYAGFTLASAAPVVMEDAAAERRFDVPPLLQENGVLSGVSTVIGGARRPFGVLAALGTARRSYSRAEISFVQALANILADAIERKAAEDELRSREATLRTIAASAQDAILMLDDGGRIVFWNDAAERMFGYTRAEAHGRRVDELIIPQPYRERHRRGYEAFVKTGQGAVIGKVVEFPARRRDGTEFTAEHSISAVKLQGRWHAVGMVRDISERKRAQAAQRAAATRLQRTLVGMIQAMATAVEKRDPYTAGHQQRVADLAAAIAREMRLAPQRIVGIHLGAAIHDIGKIYIPAEILNRPGRLSATELELIKTHPQVGYDIISGVEFPWPVAEMVLQHHERLDGSGYPQGLKDGEIRLEARILAVADVVEAMASHRPYRPGHGIEAALAEIEAHKGTRYDPQAVEACLRVFRERGFAFVTPLADRPPRPQSGS